jgi:hypothetical protein
MKLNIGTIKIVFFGIKKPTTSVGFIILMWCGPKLNISPHF